MLKYKLYIISRTLKYLGLDYKRFGFLPPLGLVISKNFLALRY